MLLVAKLVEHSSSVREIGTSAGNFNFIYSGFQKMQNVGCDSTLVFLNNLLKSKDFSVLPGYRYVLMVRHQTFLEPSKPFIVTLNGG